MTDNQPVASPELPELLEFRPPPHGGKPHTTTHDLFGKDGKFFTVSGRFPADLPDHIGFAPSVFALLEDTGPDRTWTVRDVDGHRCTLGNPHPDQTTALRSALDELAEQRRAFAQEVQENRVHTLGLEPVPPVVVGETDRTWLIHVRCSCPDKQAAAHFEHVSHAAKGWLNENNPTPWKFCHASPTWVTTSEGEGRITETLRVEGKAALTITSNDGHITRVRLDQILDLT